MAQSLKNLKQDFVSNLTGGTINEINLVTAVAPATYILYAALQTRLGFFKPYGPVQFIADFLLSAVAILFSTTLYSSFPLLLNLLIVSPAILLHLGQSRNTKRAAKPKPQNVEKETNSAPEFPKKAFLTVYRGSMMVITCCAILAVDFKVFPRRFAKVENWGTSLMDIGVGSFVFSGGMMSAKSVIKGYLAKSASQPLGARLKNAMRASLPLLVLGTVRLIMVKGVDYAEHVTEYGVHWNFFFTLGFLPPLLAILQSVSPAASRVGINPTFVYTLLSLAIAVGYQVVLEKTGLKAFVLVGDRNKHGLISQNKEGISSFAGYLSIFLAGMATGMYTLPRDTQSQRFGLLKTLAGWSLFWTVSFMITKERWGFNIAVSRRLANLPYILWVASFNTAQITAFYLVERGFFRGADYSVAVPRVLEAFNRNGLAIFLVANLLTGLVNVSINTLNYGRIPAMGVLTSYILVLTLLAVGLDYKNISIKL
ncbi:GPI-anchored wall transfer protein 1 [Choiromyces venosus 120613-1]|uniref:GPI-anchored wall transfer protein n=1 Tax=Choiromyces venosus 120613-1 TaxID=1336337 RepID=A0A3N4K155_9PEZI|nr:GPI-anchored wall transfer protein 1 [Choiromyces venosus 120613-1]